VKAGGPNTFVAHLGAGRFALARRSADFSAFDAAGLAERLVRDASGEYPAGDDTTVVALRVGVAQASIPEMQPEQLLGEAELALERSAADGSRGYAFFDESMATRVRERQSLTRALERAVKRDDELFLVFQAKAALSTGEARLAGAEALVRWRHPERGLVRPDAFIPIAEGTGLILPLGERVLKAACSQMRQWRARYGRSPRVAVNLSAHQFAAAGLVELVAGALRESGVPAESLELEITETAAMRDADRTAERLQSLHRLGVRLAIDDFGTGYSSLSYLRRFALDTIKIDKSFVDDIGRDRNAEAICAAILGMAHALGRKVVAEGVETAGQLAFLRALGCDEIQGYIYARPEPAADFERRFLAGTEMGVAA
jgi:EAL domain-containing protein (putative c-di-GMP-specific phosphodiesterase class I)